jgi:quercetin dioxygenase-like cupin family protein
MQTNGKSEVWDVFGERIICKVKAEETSGKFSIVEETSPVGGVVPPHFHNETDEAIYVIEGEYEFTRGEETIIGSKGDTLFIPRKTTHSFRNLGDKPGKLLAVISPSGFEGFFEEINKLPKTQPPDMTKIIELGKNNDLQLIV